MRDVLITTMIYSLLFIVLTTPVSSIGGGLSLGNVAKTHHLVAEILFWVATFYICASATYGAFARQDRFGLSQKHPLLNRLLSLLLLLSPFLAVFLNVRFAYILIGLLLFSHLRSKTNEEKNINFSKSRALSNMILLPMFTLALMLMNVNGYYVSSILNFSSIAETPIEADTDAR